MIQDIVVAVASELNTSLRQKHSLTEDKVSISPIIGQDDSPPNRISNKIVLSVVNVAPEFRSHLGKTSIGYAADKNSGADPQQSAPLNYEFDVLVVASFDSHVESLKLLSDAVDFFYRKPVFDASNTPQLSPDIEKVTFEGMNLTYSEKQSLWGTIGANYMPSVLFRVKMTWKK